MERSDGKFSALCIGAILACAVVMGVRYITQAVAQEVKPVPWCPTMSQVVESRPGPREFTESELRLACEVEWTLRVQIAAQVMDKAAHFEAWGRGLVAKEVAGVADRICPPGSCHEGRGR